MGVTPKVLFQTKFCEGVQTTEYTAPASPALGTWIDKFTATNVFTSAETITVNIVPSGGSAGSSNQVVKKTLQPNECYNFPELVGRFLGPGDFISAVCGVTNVVVIRAEGREVS